MDIQGTWSRDFSALLNSIWAPFYPTKEVAPKDLISQSFAIKKDVYYCLGSLFNSIEFYWGWSGGLLQKNSTWTPYKQAKTVS